MKEYLNINTLFCEEYEKETNSYKRIFDNINLIDIPDNGIEMILLVNRSVRGPFDSMVFLCKVDNNAVSKIIFNSNFIIPEEKDLDEKQNKTEMYIKHIDRKLISEPGEYNVMVFAKEHDEKENDENRNDLDKYTLIILSKFNIN